MSTRSPAIVTVAVVLSIASLVAACSGSGASPSVTATPPAATPSGAPSSPVEPSPSPLLSPSPSSAAAAELVLRVTSEGGFIAPAAHLAQLPIVAVYADGRILTPAPVPAIDPGPLVPVESVRTVGAAGVAAIRAAISAAGLDGGGGTNPGVGADTADTVFVVLAGGQMVTTRFPALGVGGPGPGRPGQPGASADPQRAAALDLLARLTDTSDAWGGPMAAPTAYVPTGYRIFVAPGAPLASDTGTPAQAVAWPLAAPLASFGKPAVPDRGISGLRVGVVRLADAATLAPLLDAATQVTPFTSGGASFTLRVSPLLPDEAGG